MNNERGAALLAAIRPGALVTIRAHGGGRLQGRAVRYCDASPPASRTDDAWAGLTRPTWCIRTGRNTLAGVTADNIISVQS